MPQFVLPSSRGAGLLLPISLAKGCMQVMSGRGVGGSHNLSSISRQGDLPPAKSHHLEKDATLRC